MQAGPIGSRFATYEDDEPIEGFAPTTHGRKRVDDHTRITRIETLGFDDSRRGAVEKLVVNITRTFLDAEQIAKMAKPFVNGGVKVVHWAAQNQTT